MEGKDQPSNMNLLVKKMKRFESVVLVVDRTCFHLYCKVDFFFQGETFLPFLQTSHPCLTNRHFP